MRLPRLTARAAALAAAVALAVPSHAVIARDAPPSFADLAAQLLPGVVNVSTSQTVRTADAGSDAGCSRSPAWRRARRSSSSFATLCSTSGRVRVATIRIKDQDQGDQDPNGDQQQGENQAQPHAPPRRLQSLGSGFVIDSLGIIVTNNHVIDGADEITVTLQDNTSLKAKLIGRDERVDLAVLQVTPPQGQDTDCGAMGR